MSSNRVSKALLLRSSINRALAVALLTLGSQAASASTVYGDLSNFDTVNDTGQICHGFEIEIDGARSTDITYTYDWNHYGPPKITEDTSDPTNPKVFIRYESAKNGDGTWKLDTSTWLPTETLQPTDGHFCTDTANYSFGCEHFGVGYNANPTAIKYHWLIDDGAGNLVLGPAVNVGTPSFVYYPPPAPAQPAQLVAVIPAPEAPNPDPADAGNAFGEATWVRVIKTTTHNANNVALGELVSADTDGDGDADWQNNEPAEVETEWKLLQKHYGGDGNGMNEALEGGPDDMGDGSETVTRRYEFYNYVRYVSAAGANPGAAPVDSLDGENGEAMCSEIDPTTNPADPNYLHGVGSENNVAVTGVDARTGETYTYYIDCSAQVMIGDYIGAQMVGFDAAAPLGLVDHLQDGDTAQAYTPRTVVVGGNSPYTIAVTPSDGLPPGMTLGDYPDPVSGEVVPGVLSGSPTTPGSYGFTVDVTDADNNVVSRNYTLQVVGPAPQQWQINVSTVGSGSVTGSGIDCGNDCSETLDDGSAVTLAATPEADSLFSGWSGACSGTASCDLTMDADKSVTATFTRKQFTLSVGKTGGGAGSVAGNGIDCGATCSVTLETGTAVTLAATPATGSVFTGWSGACSGTATCVLTLGADTTVSANFTLAPPPPATYTLTVSTSGTGRVSSKPHGINCGQQCTTSFANGSSVTLSAKATGKNKAFLGWAGACSGMSPTCTVTMSGNQGVSAAFH